MGVDYLQCSGCTSGYPDDSEYCCYCDCGARFCGLHCGKLNNYFSPFHPDENNGRRPKIDDNDSRWDDWDEGRFVIDKDKPITCVICRKEAANDYILLETLLKHYKLTREDAMKIWQEEKDNGE